VAGRIQLRQTARPACARAGSLAARATEPGGTPRSTATC